MHLTLSVLLALMASSAVAAVGSDIEPGERELILQHAYGNLTRYAAAGGESITFRVGALRTVEADEFARVRWLRLMTMPGGDMIDMMREVRQYEGTVEGVIYRPKWNLDAPEYLDGEEGRSLRGKTVADVLQALSVEKPEAARVTAISSYEVTVAFQGRTRTYRAAVLWLPPSPGRDATLFFLDHVTQGLEEAVRERPVKPRARPPLLPTKTLACYASNQSHSFSNALHGYDGHWDMDTSHYAAAGVAFACSCATDCSASCQPSFHYAECDDTASFTADACHRMATSSRVAASGSGDGSSSPPGCAAGLGCVKRSCLYCSCGLSVEVEIQGTSVTFASSGEPDWQGNLDFSYTCGACQTMDPPEEGGGDDPPYEPDEDDWGDDENGGGSGGGVIRTRSPNGSGGYTCCYWVRNDDGSRGQFMGCNPC